MQFYYKRTEGEKTFTDSFNTECVVRTVGLENEERIVLLNDGHEMSVETPDIDVRTNKVKGTIRKRDWYVSEIHLDKEDSERFIQLTKTN
jgi:hypothetical protein